MVPLQTELAAALGVSASVVTRDKARGMPTHDVDAARAWRSEHVRSRVRVGGAAPVVASPAHVDRRPPVMPPSPDDGLTYDEARRRREAAEAELAELKLAEANGRLVDRETMRSAHARAAAGFRDALLQLAARMAPVLVGEPDQAKIQRLLDAEHRHALKEFAEGGGA